MHVKREAEGIELQVQTPDTEGQPCGPAAFGGQPGSALEFLLLLARCVTVVESVCRETGRGGMASGALVAGIQNAHPHYKSCCAEHSGWAGDPDGTSLPW